MHYQKQRVSLLMSIINRLLFFSVSLLFWLPNGMALCADNYQKLLLETPVTEVEIGMDGYELFPVADLKKELVGYSVTPAGEDLTGKEEGDWRVEWVVIGRNTLVGDPLFIDESFPACPVFTAMHGQGAWEPSLLSPSLESFLTSLQMLKQIEIHFAAFQKTGDASPLKAAMTRTLGELKRLNRGSDFFHWEVLLEGLEEEIENAELLGDYE